MPAPPPEMEGLVALLSPYLPAPLTTAFAALSNPAQLIPFFISLLTLYAALMSLYSTTRFFLRALWTTAKYATLAVAVAGTIQGWKNWGRPVEQRELGVWGSLSQVYGVGKQGWDWYNTDSGVASRARGATGARRTPASNRKSASGRPRTWARPNDDGGWDDPDEIDLARSEDLVAWLRQSVITFLHSPDQATASTGGSANGKKKATKKATTKKGKKKDEVPDVADWAMDYAKRRARKAWGSLVGE